MYRTDKGRMVLSTKWSSEINSRVYTFYTPHYFDRYRERFLKDPSIPKQKVILDYFNKNLTGVIKIEDNIEDPSKPSDGMYLFSDGIALIDVLASDRIWIYKTFLPLDDLTKNKHNVVDLLSDAIKDGEQYIDKARRGNLDALNKLNIIGETQFVPKYSLLKQKKK